MCIAHNPTNVYLTPDQVRMCLGDVAMIMYTTLKVRGFDASVRGRGGGTVTPVSMCGKFLWGELFRTSDYDT